MGKSGGLDSLQGDSLVHHSPLYPSGLIRFRTQGTAGGVMEAVLAGALPGKGNGRRCGLMVEPLVLRS